MRLLLSLSLWVGMVALAMAEVSPDTPPATLRQTTSGPVSGIVAGQNTLAWLGIPYAAPPVGELRWRAPRPVEPWTLPRLADRFGNYCPQPANRALGADMVGRSGVVGSEDCLYLNVWSPRGAARLPVMVWIHGGGNTIGSASTYTSLDELAGRYGVVVVSLNYRLGVLGWFRSAALDTTASTAEDRSGNYGTLDAIAALRWVRENVAAFGGDPDRVTLFGESAGAIDALALLTSPLARGLFHGLIAQSGRPVWTDLALAESDRAEAVGQAPLTSTELMNALLVAQGRADSLAEARQLREQMPPAEASRWLRDQSAEALVSLLPPERKSSGYRWRTLFGDGVVLDARPPWQSLAARSMRAGVPVMIGTNRDESKLTMASNAEYVALTAGSPPRIRDAMVYARDAGFASAVRRSLGADEIARRLVRGGPAPVFVYRFDWDEFPPDAPGNPAVLVGASHAVDLHFTVGNGLDVIEAFGGLTAGNAAAREELRHVMRSYWTQFARTGTPGRGIEGDLPEWRPWPRERGRGAFMVLDTRDGGGVRMQSGALTLAQIRASMFADASLRDHDREFCRAWVLAWRRALEDLDDAWRDADYRQLRGGVCRSYPAASFNLP